MLRVSVPAGALRLAAKKAPDHLASLQIRWRDYQALADEAE
jgi:hypothetical protein